MKRIVPILLLIACWSGLSFAQPVPPPYPAAYWIVGKLTTAAGVNLGDFRIVFYNSPFVPNEYSDGYTTGLSDANANFTINAMDDMTMLPLTAKTYYVGVVRKTIGDKTYGVNETPVVLDQNDLNNGYKIVNLEVKENEGVADPIGNQLVDTGWIRNTNITRNGEDLVLTWGYDPGKGQTAVRIYALSGAGAAYANDPNSFVDTKVTKNAGVTEATFSGQAHDGNNYYFRVVPDPLPQNTTVLSDANNSITVGKVEIAQPANKYVFAASPFQSDNVSLAGILGEQLGSGGEFLWWNGAAYGGSTYSGKWSIDHSLRIGEGFILRARTDSRIALVGRFGLLGEPSVRLLLGGKYNLISYPYPTGRPFVDMGVLADEGSDLLRWSVAPQAYEGATFVSGRWNVAIDNLELAAPRYYRPKSNFNWTINFK